MLFQYQKTKNDKVTEVLNDLIKIHDDRVAIYMLAIGQSGNLSSNLKEDFTCFISESMHHKEQLIQKIKELNGNTTKGTTIFGKIYTAWTDLKVVLARNSQKAIISSCLYNEEIALHAYNAALDTKIEMSSGTRELIEEQEEAIRKIHSQIGRYREARYVADHSLVYFN